MAPARRDSRRGVEFAVDHLPAGDRIVRSVGLERIGQQELGAYVRAGEPHEADHQVMGVLTFIADYVSNSGALITAGQTLAYGWTMFRFSDARRSILEIEEDIEPFSPDHPSRWGPGVRRAVALRIAGDDVMRRNRLKGRQEHPNRGHTAVACAHIAADYTGQLVAERGDINRATTPWGSGWSLHCGRGEHSRDQWHQHHLTHLVHSRTFVMPYLCIPEGSMVVFDADGAIVWGAGSESGDRDPEDPRSWHGPE